jgi:hypothetical protein
VKCSPAWTGFVLLLLHLPRLPYFFMQTTQTNKRETKVCVVSCHPFQLQPVTSTSDPSSQSTCWKRPGQRRCSVMHGHVAPIGWMKTASEGAQKSRENSKAIQPIVFCHAKCSRAGSAVCCSMKGGGGMGTATTDMQMVA